MAVQRRKNIINAQRLDAPHVREIESAVSNDFDQLLSSWVIGQNKTLVVRGFKVNMAGAIGGSANGLAVVVADSAVLHGTSNTSGTFYVVPTTSPVEILNSVTNSKVQGNFTPNSTNYVSLDFNRSPDPSTSGPVAIRDVVTKTETVKNLPLAQVMNYRFIINTSGFASTTCPLFIVQTDPANNVVSITDRRDMLFRLGKSGFTSPNPTYKYPWNNDAEGRVENPSSSTSNTINPFNGGDKQIKTLKEMLDAITTELLLIKGTPFWYSLNTGGSISNLRADVANTIASSAGSITHSKTVSGRLNWSNDIFLKLITSRLKYKINANPSSSFITLSDGQVSYLTLQRSVTIVPNLVFTNGSATVASVGASVWTTNLVPGDFIRVAGTDDSGYYEILTVDSPSQVTLTTVYAGLSTGAPGTQAQYSWGVYEAVAVPTTDRHIRTAQRHLVPQGENTFWLFLRDDNGGSTAKIYTRFNANELDQGESIQISDQTTINIQNYTGMTSEVDDEPIYSTRLGALVAEETDVTVPASAAITSGQYWNINSANDAQEFYVWYNKDAGGGDPLIPGKIPIEVAIITGDTNAQVATKTAAAISLVSGFSATSALGVVTVTNTVAGDTTDATNGDVPGLSITVTTQGSGAPNYYVVDTEDLTLSIKRLDQALKAAVTEASDYDEYIEIVSSPAAPNEIAGPITAPQNITMPVDSRDSNLARAYTVGDAELEIYLNGQRLRLGIDWDEVGSPGDESNVFQILIDLEVGDVLHFRIDPAKASGSGGGGAGEVNTASNVGTGAGVFKTKVGADLRFKRINPGAGVNVTENADDITISAAPSAPVYNVVTVTGTNYLATTSNDFILVNNSGTDVTITLPTAVGNSGKQIAIKKLDAGNTMNIATVLSQTIDGLNATATPLAVTVTYEIVILISDGANWWVI